MYDALHRSGALELGAAYEAHARRAMAGVANKAGVACKVSHAHAALLAGAPSAMPLNLLPVGAYVYAREDGTERWRVWRRTELARFDQYTVGALDTRLVLSQNVSVAYTQLNHYLKLGELRGMRGPLYDVAELFAGPVQSTTRVSSGTESGVFRLVHFQPEPVQTAFAVEQEDLLRYIKEVEVAHRTGLVRLGGTLAKTKAFLGAGTGAGVMGALAVSLAFVPAFALAPVTLGLVAAAAVGGGVVGGALGGALDTIPMAARKASSVLLSVKQALSSSGGTWWPAALHASRYLPYTDKAGLDAKVAKLVAETSQKQPPVPKEPATDGDPAAPQALPATVANVVGPEFDALSMEPAQFERARESTFLSRTAMRRVLEALRTPKT
jgi:hypothetical protein